MAACPPRPTAACCSSSRARPPFGLLLGTIASSALSGTTALWFEAVFDSLAAGTFIYVATMDLMHDVFEEVSIRARKYVAAVVGFGLMSLLAIWA